MLALTSASPVTSATFSEPSSASAEPSASDQLVSPSRRTIVNSSIVQPSSNSSSPGRS